MRIFSIATYRLNFTALILFIASLWFSQYAHGNEPEKLRAEVLLNRASMADGMEKLDLYLKVLDQSLITVDRWTEFVHSLQEQYSELGETALSAYGRSLALHAKLMYLERNGKFNEVIELIPEAEAAAAACRQARPEMHFEVLVHHGHALMRLAKYTASIEMVQQALDYAEPFEDQFRLEKAYRIMAVSHFHSGLPSLKYYESTFDFGERKNDSMICLEAAEGIITSLTSQEEFAEARKWIERAKPLLANIKSEYLKLVFQLRELRIEIAEGNAKGAIDTLKKLQGSKELMKLLNGHQKILVYELFVVAGRKLENYDLVLEPGRKCVELAEGIPSLKTRYSLLHGRNLLEANQVDKAIQWLTKLEPDCQDNPKFELPRLQYLANAYEENGQLNAAQTAATQREKLLAQHDLQDETHDLDDTAENMERLNQKILMAEKEKTEAQLRANRSALDLEIKTRLANEAQQRMWTILIGSSFLLVIVVIASRLVTVRQMARQTKHLNQQLELKLTEKLEKLKRDEARSRELEEMILRAEKKQAVGELTSSLAHDFNNYLTVISQANELIRLAGQENEVETDRAVKLSEEAITAAGAMISQLMAQTRSQKIEGEVIFVTEWLDTSKNLLRRSVGPQSDLRIHCDVDEDVTFFVEPSQLTTSVINLLGNARDAIKDQATGEVILQLSVGQSPDDPDANRTVDIAVCDNGIGMNSEQIRRCTEPFFSTKADRGVGLGLFSAERFASLYFGKLEIESQPGLGSQITLKIPVFDPHVHDSESDNDKASSSADNSTTSGNRVLIVDDQRPIVELLKARLEFANFDVKTAHSASMALELLDGSWTPDAVVADINLPGQLNGYELVTMLKSQFAHLQVVMITGDLNQNVYEGFRVLQKPFSTLELISAIGVIELNKASTQ